MNPESLRKDELCFEIAIRNHKPASTVDECRIILRRLWQEEAKPELSIELADYNEGEEKKLLATKLKELVGQFEQITAGQERTKEDFKRKLRWILARIPHLRLRYDYLSVRMPELQKTIAQYQQCLQELERKANSSFEEEESEITEEETIMSAEEAINRVRQINIGKCMGDKQIEKQKVDEEIVRPGQIVNTITQNRLEPFQKLRNPMEGMLERLCETDGMNVWKLLDFIKNLLKIQRRGDFTDSQLLQLICPYTKGPLNNRTCLAIERNLTVDEYHEEILKHFVPSRAFTQIRYYRFDRLQKNGERLADFVEDIKVMNEILRLGFSEQEIINKILEAVNPEERSRFIFASKPTNFSELDELCILSQNVAFADEHRGYIRTGYGSDDTQTNVRQRDSRQNRNREDTRCYQCGERGHLKPECKLAGPKCFGCGGVGHVRLNCPKETSNRVADKDAKNV